MAKVFIDCGGYQGQSVIYFLHTFPDAKEFIIHTFEPEKDCWKYYEGLPTILHKEAVWDKDGEAVFYQAKYRQGSTMVEGKQSGRIDYEHPIKIPCIDFSKWLISNFKKDDYIIVKMNIEGAEYRVLNKMLDDGSMEYVKELYIKFHSRKISTILFAGDRPLQKRITDRGVEIKPWKLIVGGKNDFLKKIDGNNTK